MSSQDTHDDALLRLYLLGLLSAEDSEQLDELTVTSSEFVARLQAIEYDLIDAYAAGELSGEMLTAFKAGYPTFATGRAEIEFAKAFLAYHARSGTGAAASTSGSGPSPARGGSRFWPRAWRWRSDSFPRWTVAIAATLVAVMTGVLLAEHQSLRHDMDSVRAARVALDDRTRALQQQLDGQRSLGAATATELARLQDSLAAIGHHAVGGAFAMPTVIASFVLSPAMRGSADLTTITLPPKTDAVRLQLPLEGQRFPRFTAVVRDATSNRIVWQATGLSPIAGRDESATTITVPARLLKSRTYMIELTGVRPRKAPEPLSPYAFQVKRR
jgi:hypothetical protein